MKQYPSIPVGVVSDTPVTVFPKYDGSNVRAEWSRRQGWHKFGSRRRLLHSTLPILRDNAQALMMSRYGDDLAAVFRERRWDRVVAFFEFFGPRSIAGHHEETDQHEVMLIDVSVHRRGLLEPDTFLDAFGHLAVPPVLHRGVFTGAMAAQVVAGTFPGQTVEGIVAKGSYQSPGRPLCFKVKSAAWLAALRTECRTEEEFVRRS
ncbi:MAG: hypothetical protein ACI8S6_001104 [Myxococcota bacterium]|jgi:hypothetical protein